MNQLTDIEKIMAQHMLGKGSFGNGKGSITWLDYCLLSECSAHTHTKSTAKALTLLQLAKPISCPP